MVLAELKARRRGVLRQAGDQGGDHRARLLQRRPAPGHQGRGRDRRARRAAHHQRAHRGRARLRLRQERQRQDRGVRPGRRHLRRLGARGRQRRLRRDRHRRRHLPGRRGLRQPRSSTGSCCGFAKEHGVDLRKDRMALQRLKDAAEKAKIELSSAKESQINLPFICTPPGGGSALHLQQALTREKLEELTADLCERTLDDLRAGAGGGEGPADRPEGDHPGRRHDPHAAGRRER